MGPIYIDLTSMHSWNTYMKCMQHGGWRCCSKPSGLSSGGESGFLVAEFLVPGGAECSLK